jgi:hypothetical protein
MMKHLRSDAEVLNGEGASVSEQVEESDGRSHEKGNDRKSDQGYTMIIFTDFEQFMFH